MEAQPENHLKTAEQPTEQNENMIDGRINNTPSIAELEEKAKSGEQISVIALAEAIKAENKDSKTKTPPHGTEEKRPSILAQLKADKERLAAKKAETKVKKHDLDL